MRLFMSYIHKKFQYMSCKICNVFQNKEKEIFMNYIKNKKLQIKRKYYFFFTFLLISISLGWMTSCFLMNLSSLFVDELYSSILTKTIFKFSIAKLNFPEILFHYSFRSTIEFILNCLLFSALTYKIFIFLYKMYMFHFDKTSRETDVSEAYAKGSQRFATLKEIEQTYPFVPKYGTFEGSGGVPLATKNGEGFFIDRSAVHSLFIGTTRSGKGEFFVLPEIDIISRAKEQSSIVVNDPKGELAAASYDTLKERGYDVHILNLQDPNNSMSWNILYPVVQAIKNKDFDLADQLARSIAFSIYNDENEKTEKLWTETPAQLIVAIILALSQDAVESGKKSNIENINIASVYRFFNFYAGMEVGKGRSKKYVLDVYFENRKEKFISENIRRQKEGLPEYEDPSINAYATASMAGGNTRGSIFTLASSKLNPFSQGALSRMTSRNSFDLLDVGYGKKPVAIFMVLPDYDKSNHFLASLFVSQLTFLIQRRASMYENPHRTIRFILDEFGNMPTIFGFEELVTVSLGRNIRMEIFLQSYSQLTQKYGEGAITIKDNCGNQIYIKSTGSDTAEEFSKLVGNKTVREVTRSGELAGKKNFSESFISQPLLNVNELMNLEFGEAVTVRPLTRKDLKGKDIKPFPIFATGNLKMIPRYEYLSEFFDTSKKIIDFKISNKHQNLKSNDFIYDPILENMKEKKIGSFAEGF